MSAVVPKAPVRAKLLSSSPGDLPAALPGFAALDLLRFGGVMGGGPGAAQELMGTGALPTALLLLLPLRFCCCSAGVGLATAADEDEDAVG